MDIRERVGEPWRRGAWASLLGLALLAGALASGGGQGIRAEDDPILSSRAYRGHENDRDIANLARAYPRSVGTRLDDCQTCHRGGRVQDAEARLVHLNPCDYCHLVVHPPEGWAQLPPAFAATLNPYGRAYQQAGRSVTALRAIDGGDEDGDGYANASEIAALRYPGDPQSHPGQALCPLVTVSAAELRALPAHTQFGLFNANRQQFDVYATYTGVRIIDLLEAQGVDLRGATSVEILAPDGYARSFTIEQITEPYPAQRFYGGLGVADLGPECAFVRYPENTHGYTDGDTIRDAQWHILAYAREGLPLEPTRPDPASGGIVGEGPYRNVVPPAAAREARNRPDRSIHHAPGSCPVPEWDYDADRDHNAGSMVKGAVIIRIQPMPDGCEEFDIFNSGWAMVDAGQILIYGHGVSAE
ncbi:MAG: hypothetical protein GF330_06815 [Candidatus Eisenbacteria bacterium]|nr:hypothetical protein [Candidatus Eisenbacteria bacterium]